MKTAQIIKRDFFKGEIRQNHKTGFFCINDLTKIGNIYRQNLGLDKARFDVYKKSKKTKEFIKKLMQDEKNAKLIISTKGRASTTWVHPLIFFDYAMFMSPDFKIYVYKWLYDNLIVYRDESGESYKKMTGILCETQNYTPSKAALIIPQLAKAIKRDLNCDNWNKADDKTLKLRDKIHQNMSMLLSAGVEPVKAYKIIQKELNIETL